MIRRLIEVLIERIASRKSDIQIMLERQAESEERYHARIEQLVDSLSQVALAKRERPAREDYKPNAISSPLPYEALTDILGYEDDSSFIKAAQDLVQ